MQPERWRRLNELFDAALARAPEAREAFVADACGDDPALRAELQSLLAAERGNGPLDEPPPGLTAFTSPPTGAATPQLQAGQRLGPYEVVGLLGAGGMGEVYRARDPRLGREVAVKRVRAGALGAEALRRFDQEARAAGALNHPNILAVYDVGVAAGMPYVVTELLAGRTLRAELDAGRPPLRRALDLATQLAHGLAAAHQAGIVHRDLKPENLFVTTDGRLKILDFGLAKTRGPVTAGASQLPTWVATEPGTLLGTVGYMAPEQVRGEEADARADLFAAGVILHEMLAGARVFHRGTAAETMVAILNDEPPALPVLPPPGGPVLARVVDHCLEKRPADRYQSARDLAFDLEMVRGLSTSGSAAPARAGRRRWRVAGGVAAALALAAAAAVVATLVRRDPQPPAFHQLTFRRGVVTEARFTPGGDRVVYSAAWNGGPPLLHTVAVGGHDSQQLELPEAHLLAVSPRGELALLLRPQLVGWRFRGVLARAPLTGGAPRELLENVEGADWAPDGETLAVVRWQGARARLELPPGTVRFTAGPGIALGSLRFSPDGSALAFIAYNRLDRSGRLMVAERDAAPRELTDDDWPVVVGTGLAWTSDGREVLLAGLRADGQRMLRAIGRDGRQRVLATLPTDFRLWDHHAGRLLVDTVVARRETMVARSGGGERDLSWLDWSWARVLSADGGTLLFSEDFAGAGNRAAAFLRRLDQPLPVKLGEGYACDLSRDGRWALVRPPDATRLRLVPTGPGTARDLPVAAGAVARWGRFTADGSAVLQRVTIGAESHLHLQPLAGGPSRLLATDIAPDLIWIVTTRDTVVYRSREGQVLARDVADGRARPLPGIGVAEDIVGSTPGGEAIFLARPAGFVAAEIDRYDLRTGERTAWRRISPADAAGVLGVTPIVGPDGESYAYSFRRVLTDLHVASGWADLPAAR